MSSTVGTLGTGAPSPQASAHSPSVPEVPAGTHHEYFLGVGVPEALQHKVTFWPAARTRDSGCFTR